MLHSHALKHVHSKWFSKPLPSALLKWKSSTLSSLTFRVPCSFWPHVVLETWYHVLHAYSLASCTKPIPSAFNVYYFLRPSATQHCTDPPRGLAWRKVQQSVLLQHAIHTPHHHQPNQCSYRLASESTRQRSLALWPWVFSVIRPSRLCGQQGTTSMLLSAGCCSAVHKLFFWCLPLDPPATRSIRKHLNAATNWHL